MNCSTPLPWLIVLAVAAMTASGCGENSGGENNGAADNGVDDGGENDDTVNNGGENDDTVNNGGGNDGTANNGGENNDDDTTNNSAGNNGMSETLAERYPGDDGLGADPAVVWYEGFEETSIDALVDRYDDAKRDGLSLSDDVPATSPGTQSIVMSAGGGAGSASDLFKLFPGGHTQLFTRYYVKYEGGTPYHHSGVWMGGYNPPTSYPNPRAGERPDGDDRVSVAVEPVGSHPMGRRMDFYNYWRGMHTFRAPGEPTGSGSWYGNAVVHRDEFYMRSGEWMCIEFMVRLNDDPGSAEGGELAVWSEDELLYHYTEAGPLGYWIRDKFCPADADSAACLDYAPAEGDREQEVLDLQWRTTTDLRLNWIWPQNYISDGSGDLRYDDLVVATERIGCTRQ